MGSRTPTTGGTSSKITKPNNQSVKPAMGVKRPSEFLEKAAKAARHLAFSPKLDTNTTEMGGPTGSNCSKKTKPITEVSTSNIHTSPGSESPCRSFNELELDNFNEWRFYIENQRSDHQFDKFGSPLNLHESPRREDPQPSTIRKSLFSEEPKSPPSALPPDDTGFVPIDIADVALLAAIPEGASEILVFDKVTPDKPRPTESDFSSGASLQRSTKSRRHSRVYTPPEKLTKKRQTNSKRWHQNVLKEKHLKGEEYVNSNGNKMRAHKLQNPCDESCRLQCFSKVTEEEREACFLQFWKKVPTKQGKWLFLGHYVNEYNKTANQGKVSRRCKSRKYFLPLCDGRVIPACKIMFMATFGISEGWIVTTLKKKSGSPDKRGKNERRLVTVDPGLKQSVRDHIACIPRIPSHNSRKDSSKEYLTEDIQTISKMHELYLEWMTEQHPNQKNVASYRQYSDIFNNEFNIAFFLSKKDRCDECVAFENASPEDKERLKQDYQRHTINNDFAQAMKAADTHDAKMKASKTLAVVCFDFEKSLNCPKAKASVFYYRRKLGVSNFTFVDVGRSHDICYCYDETISKKGGNEVASFLWHFTEERVASGVVEFRFYSDNCFGQNKNRAIVSLYLLAAVKHNIKITHRYLEKGHTYNAADTVHSLIERKTAPHQLYTPEQWYQKIETAKRSSNPIRVERVTQSMVYDFFELASKLQLDKDVEKKNIPWQKLRELCVNGSSPHEMLYKLNLDETVPHVVSTKSVGRPVNFKEYVLKKVYNGPLPISKLKYLDLMHYCQKNLIPPEHQEFFRKIKSTDTVVEDAEDGETLRIGRPRKRKVRQQRKKGKQHELLLEDEDEENEDDL